MQCQKCGKKRKEKLENYLITATVLEGRHFAWQNMDSFVLVRVGNKSRCTRVVKNTDCPFYNEYFVFDFTSKIDKILDKNITLTVIQPRTWCRKKKVLGYFSLDVGTAWAQLDHQFYHKWAVISPDDFASGPKGYLKVDICVQAKGETPKIPVVNPEESDNIEGNLLLPEGISIERQRANFIFNIYKADGLVKNKIAIAGQKETKEPNASIEIIFAGLKGRTSTVKCNSNPEWNERISITELFPPLCQRIKVNLRYSSPCSSIIHSTRFINLSAISSDKEHGFLPTFGPAYVNFYAKDDQGDGFAGRVLMSVSTEIKADSEGLNAKGVEINNIFPIDEASLWNTEQVLLYGTIFDVTLIDKKYSSRPITFELTFGNSSNYVNNGVEGDGSPKNITRGVMPECSNTYFCHLNYEDQKPCFIVQSLMPDFRRRMYNANIVNKMAKELKVKIKGVQKLFREREYLTPTKEIEDAILETITFISASCRKYIDIVEPIKNKFVTQLDKEKVNYTLREMEDIDKATKTLYNPKRKRRSFKKVQKVYRKMELLTDWAEDGWPDIFIWMVYGDKRIVSKQINARDLLYSTISEETGIYCGKIQTLFFDPPKNLLERFNSDLICKIDLFMWIGLDRQKRSCLDMLPEGFSYSDEIPTNLIAEETHTFQCRVHLYQGRLTPGYDETGLADAFARVIIGGYFCDSHIKRGTLNPFWDETLIFTEITLYGSKVFVKNDPPSMVLEVYDQDRCNRTEFVGRAVLKPITKLADESYSKPRFPPVLKWLKTFNEEEEFTGDILVVAELLERTGPGDKSTPSYEILPIPSDIRPITAQYRIDIMFWGVRNLKKVQMLRITKPKISAACFGETIYSTSLSNVKVTLNFEEPYKFMDVMLPDYEDYAPPIILKMFDSRSFGRSTYAGNHLLKIKPFILHPLTKLEREQIITGMITMSIERMNSLARSSLFAIEKRKQELILLKTRERSVNSFKRKACFLFSLCRKKTQKLSTEYEEEDFEEENDNEFQDWWMKYYSSLDKEEEPAVTEIVGDGPYEDLEKEIKRMPHHQEVEKSIQERTKKEKNKEQRICLKIYNRELEVLPEFNGFNDTLMDFAIYKGKRSGDETADEGKITGVFKGQIKVYRWPPPNDRIEYVTETGYSLTKGYFQDMPSNGNLSFIVRVYCVKGYHMKPKDVSGKCDPYIILKMGKQVINDRDNYVSKQISPIFGKCYEMKGTFPMDTSVTIEVWDYDMATADDLIGETKIDIENRYYSKHRARCGISKMYYSSGCYAWRDYQRPTQILEYYCKKYHLDPPEYSKFSVRIGFMIFIPDEFKEKYLQTQMLIERGEMPAFNDEEDINEDIWEMLALNALHHWYEYPLVGFEIVPEHVETRSLYDPARPGIEQGKLEMWIDIFPSSDLLPPPQVDISPRKPLSYELRVTIWNTEDVLLTEDDFFVGEKKSDIFVKGWLADTSTEQSTDVHYRSLSGEGNFNWRFVFPFDYLSAEKRLVVMKKDGFFSKESEFKLPCKLVLQIWDNDTFSKNDFLGAMTMELSKFPRGARSSKKCSLAIIAPGAPSINLFKIKRTKGWWPFQGIHKDTQEYQLAGKLEAEFELVTGEDAESNPVGLGRGEPQALPFPNRPDTSFSWFRNPWKTLKYVICKQYKWKLIRSLLILLLIVMGVLVCYAFPGYTVKRILHA